MVLAAGARVLAAHATLVLPGSAQSICFGVEQRVQRFFHRRSHHLMQVGLYPPLVDPHYELVELGTDGWRGDGVTRLIGMRGDERVQDGMFSFAYCASNSAISIRNTVWVSLRTARSE